jgi:hypothetical protein
MNEVIFSVISGINIVIGIAMLIILSSSITKNWSSVSKIGFLVMALGLVGQAIYVIGGFNLYDPILDQLWMLKDIGIAIFVLPLAGKCIETLFSR